MRDADRWVSIQCHFCFFWTWRPREWLGGVNRLRPCQDYRSKYTSLAVAVLLASHSRNVDRQSNMSDSQSIDLSAADRVKVKRTIGVFTGLALNIGMMVGSGIFITPKAVIMNAGSPGTAALSSASYSLLGSDQHLWACRPTAVSLHSALLCRTQFDSLVSLRSHISGRVFVLRGTGHIHTDIGRILGLHHDCVWSGAGLCQCLHHADKTGHGGCFNCTRLL